MVWLPRLLGFLSVGGVVLWLIVWVPGLVGLSVLRGLFFGCWVDGVVARFGWFYQYWRGCSLVVWLIVWLPGLVVLSVLRGLFFGCWVDSVVARFGWFISVGGVVLWLMG